ncbi:hypothetical protein MMC19_002194 [Ptychographa xylographoides]|nr:hypothetical protein [Ptychographa xylographoides]
MANQEDPKSAQHIKFLTDDPHDKHALSAGDERRKLDNRVNTFGSVADRNNDKKLRRMETEIKKDIKSKLSHVYGKEVPPYYRLAMDQSPKGLAQNDANALSVVRDATIAFMDWIEPRMEEVSRKFVGDLQVGA